MTEQEVNNLIDSKIGKTKMSQLPEATQTSGLYSIGYAGNQSVKYRVNLLQGDPLTVRKTYQTEAEALADKNPIDATTSLPLKVGQFVSIVDDGEKNGIYRISSISGDGTMALELQGKLGDLSEYAKKGGSTKTLQEVEDDLVQLAGEVVSTEPGGNNLFDNVRGLTDKVINPSGIITDAAGWYTSPLIAWNDKASAIINKSRSWAQYDALGNVTSNWYNDSSDSIQQTLTKDSSAAYFRTSTMSTEKDTVMVNYGNTLLPFENYFLKITNLQGIPVVSDSATTENIKEMFLSESFIPQNATYTDGLINSPFDVIWADGATGSITVTRNSDNLATKVVATHIIGGVAKTITCDITRDSEGNATNSTITITII